MVETKYFVAHALQNTNNIYNCFEICPRQCLHAQTLGFIHPSTREELNFKSELPDDMQAVIEKWRIYTSSRDFEG
jgi:23S rRNA pseudouridine1911/1915/1917 synthase